MLRSFMCLAIMCLSTLPATAEEAKVHSARIATFNILELTSKKLADVDDHGHGNNTQLKKAAEILQRVRPDVVLINEIDYDAPTETNPQQTQAHTAQLFLERYLQVSQGGQPALDYPHLYYQPVNTGIPTHLDLDNDGRTDEPADAYGFGRYPGQYGMVLYSRFPQDEMRARTFRLLRWIDVPRALIPDGTSGKPAYLSPEEVSRFRLSSKSHWDIPVRIGDHDIHFLCSHPTPPVFDGEEDINGRRNHDEIRMWADYISGGDRAVYLRDDRGTAGGLTANARFVVIGDLNSDPTRSDATYGKTPIRLLLDLPQVNDPRPSSFVPGSTANSPDTGNPDQLKTSHFGRLDYVLPSSNLNLKASGIFRPSAPDELSKLVTSPDAASDHYLVWIDISFP